MIRKAATPYRNMPSLSSRNRSPSREKNKAARYSQFLRCERTQYSRIRLSMIRGLKVTSIQRRPSPTPIRSSPATKKNSQTNADCKLSLFIKLKLSIADPLAQSKTGFLQSSFIFKSSGFMPDLKEPSINFESSGWH